MERLLESSKFVGAGGKFKLACVKVKSSYDQKRYSHVNLSELYFE